MSARRLSRSEIERLLPHRGAALFLLSAEIDGGRAVGEARWSREHPHIAGHFPGLPVVPGIFLIEAVAQLAGVAIAAGRPAANAEVGVLAAVRRCLLHRPTRPETTVRLEIALHAPFGGLARASGFAFDEHGLKAATVDLAISSIDPARLGGAGA